MDSTLLLGLAYAGDKILVPFVNKILGGYADEIRPVLAERLKRVFGNAEEMIDAAKIEPKAVPLRTLKPIIDGAMLEEDESLSDKWAALLANSTNPDGVVQVQPGFADVLAQLMPMHARVLELIYSKVDESLILQPEYAAKRIPTQGFADQLGISFKDFALCVDNLLRLRLCGIPGPSGTFDGAAASKFAPAHEVVPTVFGYEFVLACTPPKPRDL